MEFLEQLAESGEEVPALQNRPHPTQFQNQFWEAFFVLSTSRGFHSAGIAAIPLSEIKSYFEIYNISDLELKHLYVTHIKSLDEVYVSHYSKKS